MKKLSFMLLIFALMLFVGGCSHSDSKDTADSKVQPETIYADGKEAMDNEDWDKAIECFTDLEYEDSNDLLEKCIREKGMHENADYDFLETMGKSLMKRYKVAEKSDDIEKCVDIELEMIGSFKDKEFYDKKLKKLAMAYIDGVEIEKQSFSQRDGHKQRKYYKGHAKRFKTLKKLTDNYGFLADNVDYKITYYNKADEEIEYFSAIKAIEADLGKQLHGDQMNSEFINDTTYRIKIKNNTKYDYAMEMHFTFYDSNDTIFYTNDMYYEDIKAGKGYNLDFYYPLEAGRCEWYTEEYLD